jgi:dihydrofolate synthase/folylpolyglutamate synthase
VSNEGSHADSAFAEALGYIGSFVDLERSGLAGESLGLARMRRILAALGEPSAAYRSVLIAGTNGKGSTAAMIERGLRASGYRTGLYTQPHLHSLRERVRLDGDLISQDGFAAAMHRVRAAVEATAKTGVPTTAYEVVTALALCAFQERAVEAAVLEIGLGGRLDAVNCVEADLAVITPIDLDHTQVLGNTVEAIAREKADVIKHGRPAVLAPQPLEAMRVLRATAAVRGSPLRVALKDGARWGEPPRQWDLLMEDGTRIERLAPSLRGGFQRVNIAVAATALAALQEGSLSRVTAEAIREAIERATWPGRFEVVEGPPTVILDGAHNVAAASALREALDEIFPGTRRVFVLGVAGDKDVDGIVARLLEPRPSTTRPFPALSQDRAGSAHQPPPPRRGRVGEGVRPPPRAVRAPPRRRERARPRPGARWCNTPPRTRWPRY